MDLVWLNDTDQTLGKNAYLKFFTLSRKLCQEMSPLRNFMLKLVPLAGMTTAIGAWASTTLLQNRSYMVS